MPRPYVPNDSYARKAAAQGYLARSAFKLESIVEKFGVVRPGDRVLDIGAAPGSWLQVTSKIIGSRGLAVGVDLNPVTFSAENVRTFVCDILTAEFLDLIKPFAPFDAVLSDAAPNTSGIRDRDAELSLALAERVAEAAELHLRLGGSMVIKIFESGDTSLFVKRVRKKFEKVQTYKPPASRERSRETYIVALRKR